LPVACRSRSTVRSPKAVRPSRSSHGRPGNGARLPLRAARHHPRGGGRLTGLEPFRRLVNDRRFAKLPMLLETPKTGRQWRGVIEVDPLDAMNLRTLRGLLRALGAGLQPGPGRARTQPCGRPAGLKPRRYIGTDSSENTSASNLNIRAPDRQAAEGRPALRQVCERKVSRSQPWSVATCGRSRPRHIPCSTINP